LLAALVAARGFADRIVRDQALPQMQRFCWHVPLAFVPAPGAGKHVAAIEKPVPPIFRTVDAIRPR